MYLIILSLSVPGGASGFDENLNVAKPKSVDEQDLSPRSPHYYPFHQQLTFRGGAGGNFPRLQLSHSVIGFNYLFPEFLSPHWEIGADLRQNARGHVHFGRRWIYNERFYFRPSLTLQFDHDFDSALGLGTLVKRQNWYARTGAALEYVVLNPYSLRAEVEFLANFDNQRVIVTLGISRGW